MKDLVTISVSLSNSDLTALRELHSIANPDSSIASLFAHILEMAELVAPTEYCEACETEVGALDGECLRCGQPVKTH